MKISELIKLEKYEEEYFKKYSQNKIKYAFHNKNGYCWNIPSHSENKSVLLNNYEKDCVVAYIQNKYLIIFLIKLRGDNFRGFVNLGNFLKKKISSTSYQIMNIYGKKNALKVFEQDKENLKIIDNEQFERFKKIVILDGLNG